MQPKKRLGQHFLTDGNIADKIVACLHAGADDPVVEIGPGTGALTGRLSRRFHNLYAVETDERAVGLLHKEYPNITVIHEDILAFDWKSVREKNSPVFVIGNLPYYITSPILFSIVDRSHLFNQAVFMVQKEVAERITASPGTRDYGIVSVQVQVLAAVSYQFTVSREVFRPRPKVESAVVSLDFTHPEWPCRFENFKRVVRTAFNQRRKQLKNSLRTLRGSGDLPDFEWTRRPEELEPGEFVRLTVLLEKAGILDR